MKRGTTKAVKLGMRMLKWLEDNEDKDSPSSWNSHDIRIDSYGKNEFSVSVNGRLKSHKTAAKFKKAFPELGKLVRSNLGGAMSFRGNCRALGVPLEVWLMGITELPKNCKIEKKEVWHDKETVVTEAGYRTTEKIVCSNGK